MTTNKIFFRLLVIFLLVLSSCSKSPDINNESMLDGDQIFDPSLYNPELYLVSVAITDPSEIQKNTPVIIAVHGYSATTFEWDEFRTYCDPKSRCSCITSSFGRTWPHL